MYTTSVGVYSAIFWVTMVEILAGTLDKFGSMRMYVATRLRETTSYRQVLRGYRPSISMAYLWAKYRRLSPTFPRMFCLIPSLSMNTILTLFTTRNEDKREREGRSTRNIKRVRKRRILHKRILVHQTRECIYLTFHQGIWGLVSHTLHAVQLYVVNTTFKRSI